MDEHLTGSDAEHQKPVTLLEELQIDAALAQNRRGQLYALAAAEIVFHALEIAWIETTSFLSKTWTNFTTGFQHVWESAGHARFLRERGRELSGFGVGLSLGF